MDEKALESILAELKGKPWSMEMGGKGEEGRVVQGGESLRVEEFEERQ